MSDLPVDMDSIDAAFSTMTYHEFASDDALAEIDRVLAPEGRLVIVDWSATGSPPHPLMSDSPPRNRRTHCRTLGSASNTKPPDGRRSFC